MGRRIAVSAVLAVLLLLGLSAAALAENYFPPIYNDYAADRDLDGTYSRAELEAYLANAEVDQYGDPVIVSELDAVVRAILNQPYPPIPPYPTTNPEFAPALPWRHATPQEIYDDYAEDGDFDWNYDEDIQAYLHDPMIGQYNDPETDAAIRALLTRMLTAQEDDRDTFPLTGAPLALLVLGAAGLAGVGTGLRRFAGGHSSV